MTEDEAIKSELLGAPRRGAPGGHAARHHHLLAVGGHAGARRAGAPDRFAALHVFNPVERMELVELCFPAEATEPTREFFRDLCGRFEKTAVEVPDTAGFVVNRLLFPYLFDAVRLLERGGLDAEAVDTCMKLGAGHPLGPLAPARLRGPRRGRPPSASRSGPRCPSACASSSRRASSAASRARASSPTAEGAATAGGGHARREVPDHVGLADALLAGELRHPVPGQGGLREVVPAGELERLERALQRRGSPRPPPPCADLLLDQRAQRVTLRIAQLDAPHVART